MTRTAHNALRELFLLGPDVVYLNHGSFGACPRPVFEAYQRWQLELERQPVEFLGRRHNALLAEARAALGAYLGASGEDLVFVSNVSVAINTVARSLPLRPGDEVLATDHEYGAMERAWQHLCGKSGARYVRQPIPLPVTSPEAVAEAVWAGVTPRTKVIFLSHLTSPTALILPVADLCRRARERGILTVIDGAHAVGQLPLDLAALGADFYGGNCHKWLCGPKGAGFLYARREQQAMLEPLVISWGWREGASFADRHEWQGTRDIAAFLAVPAAIDFQRAHGWDEVRQRCHTLASQTRRRLADLTGLVPIAPDSPDWFAQMAAAPLPPIDGPALQRRLYDEHCIEVPVTTLNGSPYLRVSFQGYNTADDADRLLAALADLLPGHAGNTP